MNNLLVMNEKIFNNVKYKKKINKQTPPSKEANSIFFPLIRSKQMVQYSCFFFELLQEALDFNDFGERNGREIIAPPTSPFLSQVS